MQGLRKIYIELDEEDVAALRQLAEANGKGVREQGAALLHEALKPPVKSKPSKAEAAAE